MRPMKPSPPSRPKYPKLGRGWKILVGGALALTPQLALGDATVPNTGDKPGNKDGKDQPPPQPQRPVYPDPPLGGAPPPIEPPHEPPKKDKDKDKKKKLGMVLHPHAPDEPCFPLDSIFTKVKV